MKKLISIFTCMIFFTLFIACNKDEPVATCEENINELRLNEYQVIGSHNSYRTATPDDIMAFMNQATELLPPGFDPATWDYSHEPILDQLNRYGIRSFELDVYRDPNGSLFYNRVGNAFVGRDVASGVEKLKSPGLKVLHFPDFDYNTHFYSFKDALGQFKSWSKDHPSHLPIVVLVEAKEDSPDLMLPGMGLTASLPFVDQAVEEIENEINDVFVNDDDHILKPDNVRGMYSTLRSAVTNSAWPNLRESRGKIIFVLMARDEVIESYVTGHPSLTNRNMFVFTDSSSDESAFLNIDDPEANFNEISMAVQQGFIVRTQADSNTLEARSGSTARREKAFDSGSQIICTDYYRADPRSVTDPGWTDYSVQFPGNQIAVINYNSSLATTLGCQIDE